MLTARKVRMWQRCGAGKQRCWPAFRGAPANRTILPCAGGSSVAGAWTTEIERVGRYSRLLEGSKSEAGRALAGTFLRRAEIGRGRVRLWLAGWLAGWRAGGAAASETGGS